MVECKMEIFTAIIGKIYLSNDCTNKFKYILADIHTIIMKEGFCIDSIVKTMRERLT